MAIGDKINGGMDAGNNGTNNLIVSLVNVSTSRIRWDEAFASATEYRNNIENDWVLPTSLELRFIFRNVYNFLNTDIANSTGQIRSYHYWTSDTINVISGTLGPVENAVIVSGIRTADFLINDDSKETVNFVRAIRRL
jgi:hypothetical protein